MKYTIPDVNQAKHPYPARPLRVIHLSGTDLEIGRQHVEALREEIDQSMPVFYHRLWRHFLSLESGGQAKRAASRVGKFFIDPLFINQLRKKLPQWLLEREKGAIEVAGESFGGLTTAMVLPDLLNMLQAFFLRGRPELRIHPASPRIGCTSFVCRTATGLLNGRNLDFPGVGYWDRFPVIQLVKPINGLRSIGFTSTGVMTNGITGINEEQISVSLHQHYCLTTSFRGHVPFAVGEEILRRARSLEEALRILKNSRFSSSWAFVVTDGKSRDGFIFEVQPKSFGVRRLDREGVLSHSNVFQTLECKREEYATTARMNWDNYYRRKRLESLVAGAGDAITPRQAVQFLSDHFDLYWNEEKPVNRTISQVYNIQSLLMDPVNMIVYHSEGDCPVQLRQYREIDLKKVFDGGDGLSDRYFPAYTFQNPKVRSAKEHYIFSFVSAFDNDFEGALREVGASLDAVFSVEAALVYSIFKMKAGEFNESCEMLEKSKGWIEQKKKAQGLSAFPPEYFETCVHLARVYDLLGRRHQAEQIYQYVHHHPGVEDDNILRIARRAKPYRREHLDKILTPYSSYIPFE